MVQLSQGAAPQRQHHPMAHYSSQTSPLARIIAFISVLALAVVGMPASGAVGLPTDPNQTVETEESELWMPEVWTSWVWTDDDEGELVVHWSEPEPGAGTGIAVQGGLDLAKRDGWTGVGGYATAALGGGAGGLISGTVSRTAPVALRGTGQSAEAVSSSLVQMPISGAYAATQRHRC